MSNRPSWYRRLGTLLHRIHGDQRGATLVEYALMLALIASLILVTCELIGMATRAPMSAVSVAMQSGDEMGPTQDRATFGGGGPRPVRELAPARANWRLAAVVVSLGLNALLWFLLYRREKRLPGKPGATEDELLLGTFPQDALFVLRQQMVKMLTSQAAALFDGRLQVRHLMCAEPFLVGPDDQAADLMDSLRQRRLRHALVCDDHQKLLGLVSRTDLIGKDQCRAHEVMTRRPKTVEPDMMLNPAITLLLTSGLTCLPVVNEDDQPVGMLSVFELVLALQCTLMSLQTMASQNELSTKVVRSRTISEIVALQQSEA